jgi:hypothetical protein
MATLQLKYLVWILEQAIAAMDASKGVEKMVWVADFKGTGMRTSSVGNMQVSMDCMHVLLNHYPEVGVTTPSSCACACVRCVVRGSLCVFVSSSDWAWPS